MVTKTNIVVVFDLDDTLYKEIDYLKSAYKEIAQYIAETSKIPFETVFSHMMAYYKQGLNTFKSIIDLVNREDIQLETLIHMYRNHFPEISLETESKEMLHYLKQNNVKIGIITDGRSKQQRNKLKALQIEDMADDIIISEEFGSEKPAIGNFKCFNAKYPNAHFLYVGDNTAKDFIAPNKLGWDTVCLLDNGKNIHKQNFNIKKQAQPTFTINSIRELKHIFTLTNPTL